MQPNDDMPNRPGTNTDGNFQNTLNSSSNPPGQPSSVPPATPLRTAHEQSTPPTGNKKKRLKLAGIIAAGVVLLAGASAGAYYGIYLPNKPENVLKKSVANTLTKKQTTGKGSAKISAEDTTAVINYAVQQDVEKNVSSMNLDASMSGAKLPLELRSIDKSLFVKVGDLSSIEGLANLYSPGTGELVSQVSRQVSNQWIEIDESLLKSTFKEDRCNPFGSAEAYRLTDKDLEQILSVYDKNAFVVIKNTSKDTVDNRSVTKMELDIDKDKSKAFGKELENVDYLKRIKECDDGKVTESLSNNNEEEFKGTYNLTVWVDKSKKELVKVALNTKDEGSQLDLDFTFTDEQVDVQKPEGAKPLMQVLGELGPLFSGLLGAGATQQPDAAAGGIDPSSLQNLEGYTNQY